MKLGSHKRASLACARPASRFSRTYILAFATVLVAGALVGPSVAANTSAVTLFAPAKGSAVGKLSAAPNPLTCEGYPEPRTFLESQSGWWKAGITSYGAAEHAHSATCFPYLQTVSGVVHFDVRSMMHNVHGAKLYRVRVDAFNNAYGTKVVSQIYPGTVCTAHDCTFVTGIDVDTAVLSRDGLTELRIQTWVEGPSGDKWRSLATNGWLVYVKNGKTVADTTYLAPQTSEGRGWYRESDGKTTRGYENARFLDRLPSTPISGTWCPKVRTLNGSDGEPITRSFVSVDPSFHAVPENPGLVLIDRAGTVNGEACMDTKRLTNGAHKLFIRADADEPKDTKVSGALVIPFTVQN